MRNPISGVHIAGPDFGSSLFRPSQGLPLARLSSSWAGSGELPGLQKTERAYEKV